MSKLTTFRTKGKGKGRKVYPITRPKSKPSFVLKPGDKHYTPIKHRRQIRHYAASITLKDGTVTGTSWVDTLAQLKKYIKRKYPVLSADAIKSITVFTWRDGDTLDTVPRRTIPQKSFKSYLAKNNEKRSKWWIRGPSLAYSREKTTIGPYDTKKEAQKHARFEDRVVRHSVGWKPPKGE